MRNWPLLDLRLTTPRLTLRLPTLDDLDDLADCAMAGVHDPDAMPFLIPWTTAPAEDLPRNVIQYHLLTLASWQPGAWQCNFIVVHDGQVVGSQNVGASDLKITREVSTGSWLGRAHQGKGIGTEMRAAVLHFAFEGLGVDSARSSAFLDNPSSLAVSRKLGYRPDGTETRARDGERATDQRFLLGRSDFVSPVPVRIHGLDACRHLFGI
ncbi:GNAT family N-acetyltransferase [Streptosporangium sp. KLBMP 9127]|nr:GNAT family N-acetyltransferase [Streptosporangium sp. KLBMP 9127]